MATQFKGQAVEWGSDGAGYSGGGICVSASCQRQAQTDAVENTQGARDGLVIYDVKYTLSATVVCKAGTTPPSIGDRISVGGVSGYVTDVKKDWQNKGKAQFSVTADGGASLT